MQDWKDIVISIETTFREALSVIDAGGKQIALVLDESGHLLGTVTDGDIRRGILKGMELDGPIAPQVFATPVTGRVDEDPEALQRRMREHSVRQIPLLDAMGRVAGLELLQAHQLRLRRDNPVVIMAGGLGTRLRPLTESCPKPMIRVGGRPVLETILINFREQGFTNFHIAVNYKAGVIEDYFGTGEKFGVHIEYIREDKRLGTAGALSLLSTKPAMPFFLMNGDVLTTMDFRALLDFHVAKGRSATMCVRNYEYQVPYGVVEAVGDELLSIVEKPVQSYFVNAGIYVLDPAVVDDVPADKHHDMTELIPHLKETGQGVSVFPVNGYWLDIGRMGDLERAECEYGEWFV